MPDLLASVSDYSTGNRSNHAGLYNPSVLCCSLFRFRIQALVHIIAVRHGHKSGQPQSVRPLICFRDGVGRRPWDLLQAVNDVRCFELNSLDDRALVVMDHDLAVTSADSDQMSLVAEMYRS